MLGTSWASHLEGVRKRIEGYVAHLPVVADGLPILRSRHGSHLHPAGC